MLMAAARKKIKSFNVVEEKDSQEDLSYITGEESHRLYIKSLKDKKKKSLLAYKKKKTSDLNGEKEKNKQRKYEKLSKMVSKASRIGSKK
jgi:hypothetical protein